jgi:two-component system, response regulator, stage 0 sporulation protein F
MTTPNCGRDKFHVLVVDDEKNICDLLKVALEQIGCEVETTCEGAVAIVWADERKYDAIFLDIKMPGMNGVEVLKNLRKVQPNAAFVMITGYAGSDLVDESLSSGAFVCLSKPFGISQVQDIIRTLYDGPAEELSDPEEVEAKIG